MKIDLTYGGKLTTLINVIEKKKLDVNYTIDGKTGKTTTTSILINGDNDNFLMITFDYQELKELVESNSKESDVK
jgi:hypothetical protein